MQQTWLAGVSDAAQVPLKSMGFVGTSEEANATGYFLMRNTIQWKEWQQIQIVVIFIFSGISCAFPWQQGNARRWLLREVRRAVPCNVPGAQGSD